MIGFYAIIDFQNEFLSWLLCLDETLSVMNSDLN